MSSGWRGCKLGDVINLKRGYDLPQSARRPGSVPIISSSGITDYHDIHMAVGPGVVTGRYGTLGEVFYVTESYWPLNTALYVSDFKGNHPRFISFFLKTLPLVSQNAAGAVPGVNRNHLHMLPVRLPTPAVQHRIASILSAYDDLIEVNQRRIAILEEMARRLFDEWFVQFRYPGYEVEELVECQFGSAPPGWTFGRYGDCVDVNPETLAPRAAPAKINYIDISSVSVGRVDSVVSVEFADAPGRARRIVRSGDVIWSTVRPNRRSHSLLLNVASNTIASTGFAVLRARDEAWAWAFGASRTEEFVSFLVGRARGSAYPAVVGTDFEEVPTLIPPLDVRKPYQGVAGPIHSMVANLVAQNTHLRAARDLLLPKLISGEIEVGRAEAAFAEAAE